MLEFTVKEHERFTRWLSALQDRMARVRIVKRIDRFRDGNFGDCKSLGDGVSEARLDFGPGYRLYYTQRGSIIVILLIGGSKKTQHTDIAIAKRLAKEISK